MDEYIKREEAYREICADQTMSGYEKAYCSELIRKINAEDVVPVQEWVSVDERLPENDVMVIGYTPCDGFMFVGYYHEEKKYDWKAWLIITAMRSTKVITKKVTHWMPLPQPPKGE